jgi:hypothetical protein
MRVRRRPLTPGEEAPIIYERLGLSEGRISQILSGSENLTLGTLAAIGWALGFRFELLPVPVTSSNAGEGTSAYPKWLGAAPRRCGRPCSKRSRDQEKPI